MRRKKFIPIPEVKPETKEEGEIDEKLNTKELTLDEIEEIRRKRERNKRQKELEKKKDKEEGELGSDEEDRTDRKKSSRHRSRSPYHDRRGGSRSYEHRRSPPRRDFNRGYSDYRRRSRSRNRYHERSRSRERYDERHGGRRERSRERDRSRERQPDSFRSSRHAIDKAKLLAIAQKNAVKLLNSNDLKGIDKGRLVAIKSGGQNLSELTLFCRELAKKGITDEFSDNEDAEHGSDDEDGVKHHPFQVNERPLPNPMGLSAFRGGLNSMAPRNALTLATMTPAMRDAAISHRLSEFPVSSGNAHRVKEADITLEEHISKIPTGINAAANAVMSLTNSDDPVLRMLKMEPAVDPHKLPDQLIQRKFTEEPAADNDDFKTDIKAEVEAEAAEKAEIQSLTAAQMLNKSNPLGVIMFGGHLEPEKPPTLQPVKFAATNGNSVAIAPPPPEPPAATFKVPAMPSMSIESMSSIPLPSTSIATAAEPVFAPLPQPSKDISEIISIRLNAMKRLSSNPTDAIALKELYDAQNEMTSWAASKNKPGQFTGHTGARVLSKGELMTGIQAWAKTEQFTKAQKVQGGFGEHMLRKMGWREGEGLGKHRSGEVDPLILDIKMDKKGLISAEEMSVGKRGRGEVLTMTGVKDLSNKHPVTVIMEVATRRKWGPPNFQQVLECGPPHKKQYIWKCTLNGVDYQSTIASENKKKAKSNSAALALQELGLMPRDPNNPL